MIGEHLIFKSIFVPFPIHIHIASIINENVDTLFTINDIGCEFPDGFKAGEIQVTNYDILIVRFFYYIICCTRKNPLRVTKKAYMWDIRTLPLAIEAFSTLRHARIILPPLLAKSRAVSLPIPAFAPVIITVLPSILFLLLQIPMLYTM